MHVLLSSDPALPSVASSLSQSLPLSLPLPLLLFLPPPNACPVTSESDASMMATCLSLVAHEGWTREASSASSAWNEAFGVHKIGVSDNFNRRHSKKRAVRTVNLLADFSTLPSGGRLVLTLTLYAKVGHADTTDRSNYTHCRGPLRMEPHSPQMQYTLLAPGAAPVYPSLGESVAECMSNVHKGTCTKVSKENIMPYNITTDYTLFKYDRPPHGPPKGDTSSLRFGLPKLSA